MIQQSVTNADGTLFALQIPSGESGKPDISIEEVDRNEVEKRMWADVVEESTTKSASEDPDESEPVEEASAQYPGESKQEFSMTAMDQDMMHNDPWRAVMINSIFPKQIEENIRMNEYAENTIRRKLNIIAKNCVRK